MNILAFDTCFNACSVAACTGFGGPDCRIAWRFEPMQTGHAERLLPMIGAVLAEAELDWDRIDRIGVTTGPGTFTGTRICVAAARAFSLARRIPVIAISSLEVLALGLADTASGPHCVVLAAVDARRDEVYVQSFDGFGLRPLTQPEVLPVGIAAQLGGARPLRIIGSGADRVAATAREIGRIVIETRTTLQPDILNALRRFAEMQPAPGTLRPLYLRPPDAKPQVGKSIPRVVPGAER